MLVAFALLLLGSVGGLVGYQRFRAAGRAIRAGSLPDTGHAPAIITATVVLVAIALFVLYLLNAGH
jgi:hypothetical protein